MQALSHIDALAADRTKTSFVSSISHELRSPLHGLLGANNFLSESQLTRFQEEMVHSISSCGRTLLDTLDHVMDFAKINSISTAIGTNRTKDSHLRPASNGSSKSQNPTTSAVNLVSLIEEVAEAVMMGFTVRHDFVGPDDAGSGTVPDLTSSKPSSRDGAINGDVSDHRVRVRVALALPPQQHAFVLTEAGSWRRIVMNIFANALKYTNDGLITVRLAITEDRHKSDSVKAVLTVQDTGQGMSNSYLENHLFRPFHQENSFAAGTGLGLSIVSQVVRSMDGIVDVRSAKGIGSTIKVSVTMPETASQPVVAQQPDFVAKAIEQMRGLRVCLLEDTRSRASVNLNSVQRSSESSYSQTLLKLIQDWFDVDASIQDSYTSGSADIIICLEPSFKHLDIIRKQGHVSQKAPSIIFVANDAMEMASLRGDARILSIESVVEVICQPVGPRKLAKCLAQCAGREEEEQDADSRPIPLLVRRQWQASPRPASPPITPEQNGDQNSDPNVLICDDNPVNLRLLSAFLKREKVSHHEATNGQEAVDRYTTARGGYLVTLIDISMPVMVRSIPYCSKSALLTSSEGWNRSFP